MQKQKSKSRLFAKFSAFPLLLIAAVMAFTGANIPRALADQFDAQINALNQDTAAKRADVAQLGSEAASLSDVIAKLQAQIDATQSLINSYKAKQTDLENQITAAQTELDKQKTVLGANIQQVYYEGDISTLEVLASSHDLSEFVDKQEYRNSVNDQIQDTLTKITNLKHQLSDQKQQVEQLLKDQENAQAQLSDQQAQQNQYLSANQDQQSALNSQIKQNSAQVASLRAAQAAANRTLGGSIEAGDPGHGGYPAYLNNASEDSLIDPWGMFNRECVSYTAWKVYQNYGHMPYWGGVGNANQWPGDAQAAGIPTGSTPRAGAVAISMSGFYGHAMWVEYTLPNGYIHVSQYNYDLAGHYSEMTINGAGLIYIYFQ